MSQPPRIKPLPSDGKEARRRYRLHANLRRKGLDVNVRKRTIYSASTPAGITEAWCNELKPLGYCIQLTIN